MDLSQFQPYLPYAAGVVALMVVYELVARVRRGGPRKVTRDVNRYMKEGNYLAAGKLLEDQGRPRDAVDVYLEGREHYAAAATLEGLGHLEKAAELYLQAGDYKKSAKVMIAAGKPGRAATLFLEKGNTLEAARLFGLAGAWDRAGDLYLKGGYPLRAAEAFEKKGDFARAGEAYERHFMEHVSYGTAYSATAASPDQKSALQAGKAYEKAGDLKAALQIYTRGGFFKEAASVSWTVGNFPQAAEYYLRADDLAAAADAYDKVDDKVKAANLRGEVALKEGRVAQAASCFQQGLDFLRAAELFESLEMHAQAAAAFEAGESWSAAGSVYARAGLHERAAAAYERAGELETAAQMYERAGLAPRAAALYEKAGLTFRSGEAAAQAGDRDRAIALLQRVPPSDENHAAAAALLGRLFVETGRPALAVERLQKAIGGEPVSQANLDLYYWLAVATAATSPSDAIALFERIQAESLHHRDVDERLAALRARAAAPPPPPAPVAAAPPPPSPAPSAPGFAPAHVRHKLATREEIGGGPLGLVLRAEDLADGRSVALRILPAGIVRSEADAAALAADVRAASRFSHPNAVKVLGLIDHDGQRAVVTEFVAGRNFAEVVRKGNRTTPQQAHSIMSVLAQCLAAIHGEGLVHGSVQPSNIMVAGSVVKLADLGLGRLAHAAASGDTDYRAPERVFDRAGDLHALAAVVYHLLTGVHPRTLPQGAAMPLPSTFAPGVPEAMDKLLLRALHPKVALRHPSAEAILGELKDMIRLA
jgi:tetratricopeptide (TPR) repeat protein